MVASWYIKIPIIITKKLRNITIIFKDKDDDTWITKYVKKLTITPNKAEMKKTLKYLYNTTYLPVSIIFGISKKNDNINKQRAVGGESTHWPSTYRQMEKKAKKNEN